MICGGDVRGGQIYFKMKPIVVILVLGTSQHLTRFPNCHECPVASGLGNLTTQHLELCLKNFTEWWESLNLKATSNILEEFRECKSGFIVFIP